MARVDTDSAGRFDFRSLPVGLIVFAFWLRIVCVWLRSHARWIAVQLLRALWPLRRLSFQPQAGRRDVERRDRALSAAATCKLNHASFFSFLRAACLTASVRRTMNDAASAIRHATALLSDHVRSPTARPVTRTPRASQSNIPNPHRRRWRACRSCGRRTSARFATQCATSLTQSPTHPRCSLSPPRASKVFSHRERERARICSSGGRVWRAFASKKLDAAVGSARLVSVLRRRLRI